MRRAGKGGLLCVRVRQAVQLVGVCAAIALPCAIHTETASAANSLYACFTLGGRAIPVSLAELEATNRAGNWVPIDSVKLTQANGCVSYSLWGTYTRYNLRVVVAGVTPDATGLVLGVSRYYAPGAYGGSYNLGRWETTVVRGTQTNPWLMRFGNDSASPAGMVSAFSDTLGPSLNGSVLCPHSGPLDSDCDGVNDAQDLYPRNFRWQR
jgi:hypothetical protein